MQNIPRAVFFKNGICVGVGTGGYQNDHDQQIILRLPTDHFDFVGPFADMIKGLSINGVIAILYQPRKFFTKEETTKLSGTFLQVTDDAYTAE